MKESYYMVIPATVWDAPIRDKAKLCYGHITVLAHKEGFAFASNAYFGKVLGVSKTSASQYISELEKLGVIRTEVILKEDSKQVEKRKIYLASIGTKDNFNTPNEENLNTPIEDNFTGNNTSINNTSTNNIDDVYGKIFFKIVDAYPTNRIGNRQHGLKKFKQLDIEEAKLAAVNLKRYLAVAGEYVKSLQNYIDQKCFTESWLKAEEETRRKKASITNTNHNFSGNYNIIE